MGLNKMYQNCRDAETKNEEVLGDFHPYTYDQ